MKIFLLEDDPAIRSFLCRALGESGYEVDAAPSAEEGMGRALEGAHNLFIVDLSLPGMDGLEFIERCRAQRVQAPVLILSARRSVDERVQGLEKGGDDCLTKPFALAELLARVRVLLRRTGPASSDPAHLRVADLDLDLLRRETDLGRMTARMVEVYRPAAEERGLELEVSGGEDVTAAIDTDLVGRALANLLDNALQHLPPGSHIRISARNENDDAVLEVTDDGPGFSPEVRERALERFVRGRGSKGSGLGLALVNAAAQAHGGDVHILDSSHGGAIVRIRLPRAAFSTQR